LPEPGPCTVVGLPGRFHPQFGHKDGRDIGGWISVNMGLIPRWKCPATRAGVPQVDLSQDGPTPGWAQPAYGAAERSAGVSAPASACRRKRPAASPRSSCGGER
jgi:hypothetical protein